MEILTLLKANIHRKKGSFVSVILLTLIITMSVTTILSIKESAFKGVNNAHEICDTSDLLVMYRSDNLNDDLVEKIKSDDRVKCVDIVESIFAEKAIMGNENFSVTRSIIKYDEYTRV